MHACNMYTREYIQYTAGLTCLVRLKVRTIIVVQNTFKANLNKVTPLTAMTMCYFFLFSTDIRESTIRATTILFSIVRADAVQKQK